MPRDSRAPKSTEARPGGRGPAAKSHKCPCGCSQQIAYTRLMCRTSWGRVPRPIRDAVWRTWDSGAGAGSPQHTAAIEAAVAAVSRT